MLGRLLLLLPTLVFGDLRPGPVTLERQEPSDGRLVWHTGRFRIESQMRVPDRDLQRLAAVADTTARAIEAHALPFFAPPENARPRLLIFASDRAYTEAGATPGTAGMYSPRREAVFLNGAHLYASAPGSRLRASADEDLVVHEIAHLCMHRTQPGMPQWLSEGVCEYFACAHVGAGVFRFGNMDREIREHLRRRFNPRDPRVDLVPVAEIAQLDARGWVRYVTDLLPQERYQAYATALLLAHYHLHGGDERREQLRKLLLRRPRPREKPPALVEDAAATEASLVRYWKGRGLTLVIGPGLGEQAPAP